LGVWVVTRAKSSVRGTCQTSIFCVSTVLSGARALTEGPNQAKVDRQTARKFSPKESEYQPREEPVLSGIESFIGGSGKLGKGGEERLKKFIHSATDVKEKSDLSGKGKVSLRGYCTYAGKGKREETPHRHSGGVQKKMWTSRE